MKIELPEVLASVRGLRAAEIVIDGLSVFCFNKTNREWFWEVAYPRQARHKLTIKIQELDGAGRKVRRPKTHHVDPHVEKFYISLENGSLEHYKQFPDGGPKDPNFNRNGHKPDPHDLGWMIDLAGNEIGHGDFLGFKPRDENRRRSIANIRHSLFCNLEPEEKSVRISPRHDNNPDARGSFDLGRTNTFMVGVLLAASPGKILFEFHPGGLTAIDPLPHDQNQRYRIEIINDDTHRPHRKGRFVRGDLRVFYDELINVSGPEKDLWAIPNVRVSPEGDCHPPTFSGATLEPLILL